MGTLPHAVRWGIIGCGNVTEVKSGPALQKAEGSALVAVMRRNAALAKDYAARHQVAKWYDAADQLIHDPQVDAVYIATPPSSHKAYTLAVAKAGKPVYVEKPMALHYQECEAMIRACEEAGVPLFVAYYRRALPRFLKLKQLLDDGAIGAARGVQILFTQPPSEADLHGAAQWRVDPAIAGGGYFVDLASHMLDILQFLLGPIVRAEGHASNLGHLYAAEDTVSGSFTFASGMEGAGLWSFVAGSTVDRTEIVGTEGSITFATFGESPIVLQRGAGREEFAIANPRHIQQPLIQTIVDELRGKGTSPSTGRTGAMTSWVMDRMLGIRA